MATFNDYSTETLVPGTYTFAIRATADSGDTQTATFDWVLTSPCEAPGVVISDPGQADYEDDYTGVEQTVTLTPFETVPAGCAVELTYECTGVVAPDGSDVTATLCAPAPGETAGPDPSAGEVKLQAAYADIGALPPGAYTFTITASSKDGTATATGPFTWTLEDPCDELDTFEPT